jgi:hypothetical protein
MRHRIEAVQGRNMGLFTVVRGPPAIPPVIPLMARFEVLLSALFAPVRLPRVTQSKFLIRLLFLAKNGGFGGQK